MDSSPGKSMKVGNVSRVGLAFRTTSTFLGRQLWVWPAIAAVLLCAAGWWVNASVEAAMRKQVADALNTTLQADVTSLRTWMKDQENNARILAYNEAVAPMTRDLLKIETRGGNVEAAIRKSPRVEDVRAHFRPRLAILNYVDLFLIAPSGLVLAATQEEALGRPLTGYRREFFADVLAGNPSVSHPYPSATLVADHAGVVRTGVPTMLTGAPVKDDKGNVIAVVAFRIRPDQAFTRILQVAQAGETGETYAFNRDGLMLSMSRFDDELKRVGLLADNADAKSILTIEVRDPGVNMIAGGRPEQQRARQPLTRMAADAVAGNSGSDVEGYRDYRGVNVVGAWAWLPEYEFGVATEMDVAEAYQPLRVLRYAFWTLIGLLAVSALVILLFTVVIARQRAAVHEAVLAVKQLGQYTLEEKIGAGGMGSVFKARHAMLRRPTAIKLLDAEKMSELSVARFEREVQLTSQLNHPNTIAIYDFGHTPEGLFYYAMEYLDGIDLEDLVYRFGPLPEARVIHILRQICGSLAEAHALGLIHRDIKPANIILTHRGGVADFVKVLDFGLARAVEVEQDLRLTAANVISGTPQYMAPEAIDQPQNVDARTDLYAVGAVAYYLVTGKTVFDGNSVMEVCMKQMKERPMLPSDALGRPISPWLEALILKCLGKTPRERPPSAASLEAELAECKVDDTWTQADADKWWRRFKSEAGARALQDPQATQPTPHVGLETAPFGKAQ